MTSLHSKEKINKSLKYYFRTTLKIVEKVGEKFIETLLKTTLGYLGSLGILILSHIRVTSNKSYKALGKEGR